MSPALPSALKYSYRNQSLLFYAAVRAEPKLGMERSSSEKESTIYLQTTLKDRRTIKLSLGIKDVAGSHDTTEKSIEDEIEPAASLTLSKKTTNAMSKLGKEMDPSYCIDYVDFMNYATDHQVGCGENLR